ncbi:MAG: hypothetical protein DDT27_00556 [Dehalococcoidia bacterium]|nr:hypothetical protein [Chloroflexota bacterium]
MLSRSHREKDAPIHLHTHDATNSFKDSNDHEARPLNHNAIVESDGVLEKHFCHMISNHSYFLIILTQPSSLSEFCKVFIKSLRFMRIAADYPDGDALTPVFDGHKSPHHGIDLSNTLDSPCILNISFGKSSQWDEAHIGGHCPGHYLYVVSKPRQFPNYHVLHTAAHGEQ